MERQLKIDKIKKELAIANGIAHYVEIKYDGYQYNHYINYKNEIIKRLNYFIDLSDINWEMCHKKALEGMCKNICNKYNEGVTNVQDLTKIFNCGETTIRNNLRMGKELGWCNYDTFAFLETKAYKKKREKITKEQSKKIGQYNNLTDNLIKIYPSIQQAQRELNISHIWDCCVGRRNTAGGYKWKYIEEEVLQNE